MQGTVGDIKIPGSGPVSNLELFSFFHNTIKYFIDGLALFNLFNYIDAAPKANLEKFDEDALLVSLFKIVQLVEHLLLEFLVIAQCHTASFSTEGLSKSG
jgi:hypothetical protein